MAERTGGRLNHSSWRGHADRHASSNPARPASRACRSSRSQAAPPGAARRRTPSTCGLPRRCWTGYRAAPVRRAAVAPQWLEQAVPRQVRAVAGSLSRGRVRTTAAPAADADHDAAAALPPCRLELPQRAPVSEGLTGSARESRRAAELATTTTYVLSGGPGSSPNVHFVHAGRAAAGRRRAWRPLAPGARGRGAASHHDVKIRRRKHEAGRRQHRGPAYHALPAEARCWTLSGTDVLPSGATASRRAAAPRQPHTSSRTTNDIRPRRERQSSRCR